MPAKVYYCQGAQPFFFLTCARLLFWRHAVNLIACRGAVQEGVCQQWSSSAVWLCEGLIPAAITPTDNVFPLQSPPLAKF